MSEDLEHALEIIRINKRRLQVLEKQAAAKGIDTPPATVIEIEDIQEEIRKRQQEVDAALGGLAIPPTTLAGGSSAQAQAKTALAQSTQRALAQAGMLVALGQQRAAVFSGAALVLDPPELPSLVSPRTTAITDLFTKLGDHTWSAVHGATSTGKTILVRLACDRLGGRVLWISFSGLADDAASSRLEQACAALTGLPPPPVQRGEWYRAAADASADPATGGRHR